MKIPSMCIDDFFEFPDDVVNFSCQVQYQKNVYGISPGHRSERLEEISPMLCRHITLKVISQVYSSNVDIEQTSTHFMKVPYRGGEGITHIDQNTITAIIYLNKVGGCGTSVYKRKHYFIDHSVQSERVAHFERDYETPDWIRKRDEYNSNFEEVMSVKGMYNTALVFNGYLPHRMNVDDIEREGDRLTLIQFISGITAPESPEERYLMARAD